MKTLRANLAALAACVVVLGGAWAGAAYAGNVAAASAVAPLEKRLTKHETLDDARAEDHERLARIERRLIALCVMTGGKDCDR